jgi:mitogen-activated protein kinase kinase kinase 4
MLFFTIAMAKWSDRVKDAVEHLDRDLEDHLLRLKLIGKETETHSPDRVHIKAKAVTFSWQRGIKIGVLTKYLAKLLEFTLST